MKKIKKKKAKPTKKVEKKKDVVVKLKAESGKKKNKSLKKRK